MLRRREDDHTGSYCEGVRRLTFSKKMDDQAYARRSLQRGRFPKATPRPRGAVLLARDSRRSNREHAVQQVKVRGKLVSRSATQPKGARAPAPL